jgi:hypothetical protein
VLRRDAARGRRTSALYSSVVHFLGSILIEKCTRLNAVISGARSASSAGREWRLRIIVTRLWFGFAKPGRPLPATPPIALPSAFADTGAAIGTRSVRRSRGALREANQDSASASVSFSSRYPRRLTAQKAE